MDTGRKRDPAQLEAGVDSATVDRGGYLPSGRVMRWTPRPDGSWALTVDVTMGSDGTVGFTHGSCPYDDGPGCKHVVAVLLAVRAGRTPREATSSPLDMPQEASLRDLIHAQPQARRADQLWLLANDSEVLVARLRLEFAEGSDATLAQVAPGPSADQSDHQCRGRPPRLWARRRGGWRARGVRRVGEIAQGARDDRELLLAVPLDRCLTGEMAALILRTDDSGGWVGGMVEDSLARLDQLDDDGQREKLFGLLLGASTLPVLDDGSDWQEAP